ncbi:ATP-binding protein [Streptomyces lavendulocolor]|uniref:ATP-binding protein n=1 Tax=Streptomyces lavendulocolor TaxID=67316 RepID=UPI003C2B289E
MDATESDTIPNPVTDLAPGRPTGDCLSWRLAHRPQEAGTARRAVQAVMDTWQLAEDVAQSVLVVVSELIANAVEHALPPVALHLHRDGLPVDTPSVWVVVTDGGPTPGRDSGHAALPRDEHGRGLQVVEALSSTHGLQVHATGTISWARLTAVRAPSSP